MRTEIRTEITMYIENLVLSAIPPDTMVAAVAQNTVWKMSVHSAGMLESPTKDPSKRWISPMKPFPAPCMRPKPMNQKRIDPSMKSTKFFMRMLAEFFDLVKPASTSAKPGCMKNTSIAAMRTHTVSRLLIVEIAVSITHYFLSANTLSPCSPVLIDHVSSTGLTKIRPSPTSPVCAALRMASMVDCTNWSRQMMVISILEMMSVLYITPR